MTSRKTIQDDCFRTSGPRMLHRDALKLLEARTGPIADIESVGLFEAAGRVLAEDIAARDAVPARDNAAVDGYGFASSPDLLENGGDLPVIGQAAAGHPFPGAVPAGSAIRILTGALVPEGVETIIMNEDVEVLAELPARDLQGSNGGSGVGGGYGRIRFGPGLKTGANIRRSGEDVAGGETVFEAGHIVRPQDLAALASIGAGRVACRKRLKVGIVSTGDEIRRAGEDELRPGQVYDANAPMLAALVQAAGCEAHDLGVWEDDRAAMLTRLKKAASDFDVLLTSGGASQGKEDHMAACLEQLGSRHLWQLAIKPGRPLMFGQIGETIAVGLPGNPVAVFVCFLMYAHPLLRHLSGAGFREPIRFRCPADFAVAKRKTGRREFWRASLVRSETGEVAAVHKFERDGSGLITGIRVADGLIEIEEDVPAVAPGDVVSFIPFSQFGISDRLPVAD